LTSRIAEDDYASARCRRCGTPLLPPAGAGRPRQYCSEACGRAARRETSRTPYNEIAWLTQSLAAEYARAAEELAVRARGGHALEALGMLTDILLHTEPLLRDALIQQARRSGASAKEMAAQMKVSPTVFARHHTASAISRRLAAPRPQPRRGIDGAAREARRPDVRPAPRPEPPTDPALLLAQALGELVEAASLRGAEGGEPLSRQDLAARARVHPSYLSKVVAGKRRPSWAATRRITVACGGDVPAIRTLWEEAARSESVQEETPAGTPPNQPSTLHDLLQGLHLAAGRPTVRQITSMGGGDVQVVSDILDKRLLPWEAVSRFVTALGGDPDTAFPLWTLAYATTKTPAVPAADTSKDNNPR
jgi:transcriptional regulator with XRE-family HTH domain